MDRVTRSIISIIMFLLSLCSITYTYAQESDDTEVSHKRDGTPYTDDDIVENILIKKNGKYYKKKLSYVTPMDFVAKGDGKSDDSKAFMSALNYAAKNNLSTVYLNGEYVYNLNNSVIDIPSRLVLKFDGAIVKNGKLKGYNTSILADPVKIFDNIELMGNYIEGGNVFVEWFGTFPNDIHSVDLKTSLEKLNTVYFNIKLNSGIYYTKEGNISLKGIKGVSQNKTFIEFNTNESDKHLFHIGKVGGTVAERTYESNTLESVALVLSSSKRTISNTLLIVGASHKSIIRDVKFVMNAPYTSITASELSQMALNEKLIDMANVAIAFDGSSELTILENIFTLSDIGIKFSTNTDFVNIRNYTSWNGNNGFATVYFKDTTSSNILFDGNQSWSQGLYGVYAADETGYNSFVNVKFENLRIEQLNESIKKNEKVLATSFRFGDYTHIPNLIFSNVMLGGTGNGFRFGKVKDGRISIRDTEVFYDKNIMRNLAFGIEFLPEATLKVEFSSTQLPQDLPIEIKNGKVVSDENGNRNYWGKAKIISE